MTKSVPTKYLIDILEDTHSRTIELLEGLDHNQLMGPKLPNVNPLLWEIGHVAWFSEQFILRKLHNMKALNPKLDSIYDSIAIEHSTRWDLPLLRLNDCLSYINNIKAKLCERLNDKYASEADSFIYQFATFHQDMHNEAYTYSRQTLGYNKPYFLVSNDVSIAKTDLGPHKGDATVPGGIFTLGAKPLADFFV